MSLLARSSVMSSPSPTAHYGVVVPVKPPAVAKSRLLPLGDDARRALVVAFAADTVSAALDCPMVDLVLVVTDDFVLADGLAALGASVIPDGVAGDLNGTLLQAAAEVHRRHPELRIAALCADLAALRPDELGRALGSATRHRQAFVADAEGSGTTLLAAASVEDFRPCFGPGSREAHAAAGAVALDEEAITSVRRDVDTPDDLAAALDLGVGPRTAMVATGLRL